METQVSIKVQNVGSGYLVTGWNGNQYYHATKGDLVEYWDRYFSLEWYGKGKAESDREMQKAMGGPRQVLN